MSADHTRERSHRLPEQLIDELEMLEGRGQAYLLCTTGDDGYPHMAMLSAGELLVWSEAEVRIALRPGSGTTANLVRDGKALLFAVAGDAGVTVELEVRSLSCHNAATTELACFAATVRSATSHRATYARIESGATFQLIDHAPARERWRATHAALEAAG